jgi:hypothetical protein
MSTPSALASEVRPYCGPIIRIVEAQHRISTNRLATSAADQVLLEALAEDVKPQLPASARHLPWLLASPFRYGLGRPSRFRAPDTLPGIFYSSEDIETAVTEAAYWRLVGFALSPGFQQPHTPTPMSAFSVMIEANIALDLTDGAFARDFEQWTHPSDYTATQLLASDARQIEVGAIRAPSARRRGGINVAVLQPTALVPPPKPHSSWAFIATDSGLIATKEMSATALRFERRDFDLS